MPDRLRLELLHQRHAISEAVCNAWLEAAAVSLSRRHNPPATLTIGQQGDGSMYVIEWVQGNSLTQESWQERRATEDGAYAVALAAIEAELGLFGLMRTRDGSRVDFYVGPAELRDQAMRGMPSLRGASLLEVSGIADGTEQDLQSRFRAKLFQARQSSLPFKALAAVAAFGLLRVELGWA